jgi:Holliday junction resolvase RusA-like endonuclease
MSVFFAVPGSWSKKKRAQALAGAIWPTVKPDADNSLKLTDALNAIVFCDDKQVVIATVFKCYSERPGLSIEIETMGLTEPPATGAA